MWRKSHIIWRSLVYHQFRRNWISPTRSVESHQAAEKCTLLRDDIQPEGLMLCTALRAVMICQACGLDKQKSTCICKCFLLAEGVGFYPRTKKPATGSLFAHCGAPSCSNPQSLDTKQKTHQPTAGAFLLWRREWDSNPRALSDKRFSRPPRYDHFDIPPCVY